MSRVWKRPAYTYVDVEEVAGSVRVEVPTVTVSDDDEREVEEAVSIESDVEEGTFVEDDDGSAIVAVVREVDDDSEEEDEEVEEAEEVDVASRVEGACPDADVDATWDAVSVEDRRELEALLELTLTMKAGI